MSNKPKEPSENQLTPQQRKTNAERWDALPKSTANIGDSLESRSPGLSMLGGSSDVYTGLNGLNAFWPAAGLGMQQGLGIDGDGRTINSARMTGGSSNENQIAWAKTHICRHIYESDGYVASIIDLMADFCTKGISFVHKDKAIEKLYNNWAKKINLVGRFRRGVIDALVSGNLFWYRIYANLSKDDVSELKKAKAAIKIGDDSIILQKANGESVVISPKIEYDSDVAILFSDGDDISNKLRKVAIAKLTAAVKSGEDISLEDSKIEAEKNRVPWKYISMNPMQMYPEPDGSWSYLITQHELVNWIEKLDVKVDLTSKTIKLQLPNGIKGNLKRVSGKDGKSGFYAEMKMDKDRLTVLQYSKFDWTRWATPTLWKAFPTIEFKDILRGMEKKTARSAINTVTLWKLGDHKEGLLPTSEHFERLADMLKAPSQTLNILWSSAISAEVIQPKMEGIFNPQRWEELRKEIIAQFGISQAVVTGEGGGFSSSYISVQGLLEKLNTIRELFLEQWLYTELKLVADALDFKDLPKVMFDTMSLKDEKAEKLLLTNLLDRGFISDETVYEYLGRDADTERRRIKDQQEFEDKEDLVRRGPFMIPEGQSEIVAKQLKSQEKMAENSNILQEKQIKNDKKMNQQKVDNDAALKEQQMQLNHTLDKEMVKRGSHPSQIRAKNPPKPKKSNGRPPGSTGPQTNKRTPKPKQSTASIDLQNLIQSYDTVAKQALCEIEGKKFYKELGKESKGRVIDIISMCVAESLYEDSTEPTVESVKSWIGAGLDFSNTHPEFMQIFFQNCANFAKSKLRKPTKAETLTIISDTYKELNEKLNTTIDDVVDVGED